MEAGAGLERQNPNEYSEERLRALTAGKRVTFITTREPDYIRCSQEIRLLRRSAASVRVIASSGTTYRSRLKDVYRAIRRMNFGDDVIFLGFAPQLVLPLFHRKFSGHVLIQDFFLSVYDTLVLDRRRFRTGSLAARLLHRLDEKTLQFGNLVVADTNADADYFAEEFQRDRGDFLTLYLEADPAVYRPPAVTPEGPWGGNVRRQDRGAGRSFRVLYFGSILPLQGIDVILEAVRILLGGNARESSDREDAFTFEIIGPVPGEQKVTDPRIRYIDWLPQERLAAQIAGADLCLAGHFAGNNGKAKRTIAGKTFIYRAMNKPVVLGDGPANHELFREEKGKVYYCRMGDPQSLAEAIRRARRDLTGQPLHKQEADQEQKRNAERKYSD